MKPISILLLLALGLVPGCGVIYTSPDVREEGAGVSVSVVEVTSQSVQQANAQAYAPRSLPDYFFQSAGAYTKKVERLPDQPYIPEELRDEMNIRVPPAPRETPYQIGVGDVVLLATKATGSTVEQLSGLLAAENQRQGYTVRDDGAISIPDVGAIAISGLTLEEAEARVFDALLENQIDPVFSLEVAEFNSQKVAVGGAVGQNVVLPVTLNRLTLSQALTQAGGLTLADDQFALIRLYRDGTLYQIPMTDYLARQALQKTLLVDGDAVYVDTSYDVDRALYFYQQQLDVITTRRTTRTAALNELDTEISIRREQLEELRESFETRLQLGAEERDYVYITGEVETQARYPMPYNTKVNLADVLYDNGGFRTATADAAHIYVLRMAPDFETSQKIIAWHLNASNAANITLATRMSMYPDDIVFVEEQPITKWGRSIAQIFPSVGNYALNAVVNP